MLWKKFIGQLNRGLSFLSLFLVAFYQSFLSGTLGMGSCCRFYPTCSDYALEAYKRFSFLEATKLVFKRLLRCRPLGPSYSENYIKENPVLNGK